MSGESRSLSRTLIGSLTFIGNALAGTFTDTLKIAKDLFKILIPAIVVVKVMQELGIVTALSALLAPLMASFGLPGEMAIVWTTAIVTNLYGAISVLIMLSGDISLSAAQMTVLCTMMLVSHAFPVELALGHRVGAHFIFLAGLRFFGSCAIGWLLHLLYSSIGALQEPAIIRWTADIQQGTLLEWCWGQIENLGFILCVLFTLLTLMRLLKYIGFINFMGKLLRPLLLLIGVSPSGASIAVFGLLAGITFGSGLLLSEIKNNSLPVKDVVLVLAFLSLCHGVIEDTTLMLLLGADLSGILIIRTVFALIIVTIIARQPFFAVERLAAAPSGLTAVKTVG